MGMSQEFNLSSGTRGEAEEKLHLGSFISWLLMVWYMCTLPLLVFGELCHTRPEQIRYIQIAFAWGRAGKGIKKPPETSLALVLTLVVGDVIFLLLIRAFTAQPAIVSACYSYLRHPSFSWIQTISETGICRSAAGVYKLFNECSQNFSVCCVWGATKLQQNSSNEAAFSPAGTQNNLSHFQTVYALTIKLWYLELHIELSYPTPLRTIHWVIIP